MRSVDDLERLRRRRVRAAPRAGLRAGGAALGAGQGAGRPHHRHATGRRLSRLEARHQAEGDGRRAGVDGHHRAGRGATTRWCSSREPKRGTYKKLIIRNGRLVGGILLGDISKAAYLMQAFDRNTPAARGAAVAAVRHRRAAQEGHAATRCRRRAGLQLQRRVSKGAIGACVAAGKRSRQGGDGGDARRHGLRLVQGAGDRARRLGLRRRGGGGSLASTTTCPAIPLAQAGADPGDSRARAASRCRPCSRRWRAARRMPASKPAPGLAAAHALARRVRGRARRPLHQRPRPRQHPEGRHLLRHPGDARRHLHRRPSCGASPTSPRSTTCRW